jgi:hypothetical protein
VRRLVRGLLALALLLGLGLAWARLFAGHNFGPLPGGWLHGEVAAELPADWSFANREDYLLVESDAWTLPYTTRVWFLAHQGRIHLLLPGFFGDGLKRRLDDDPRVRIAFDGKLYDQVAVEVGDSPDTSTLLAPVIRRQFAIEISGAVRRIQGANGAQLWVYRLEDPPRG